MIVTRRKLFGLILLPALPLVPLTAYTRETSRGATQGAPIRHEWEVRGFSLFSGPNMLETLRPGFDLDVVIRGQGTGWLTGMVFARGSQIGYLETTPHDTIARSMPGHLIVARIVRNADGRHRMWGHAFDR